MCLKNKKLIYLVIEICISIIWLTLMWKDINNRQISIMLVLLCIACLIGKCKSEIEIPRMIRIEMALLSTIQGFLLSLGKISILDNSSIIIGTMAGAIMLFPIWEYGYYCFCKMRKIDKASEEIDFKPSKENVLVFAVSAIAMFVTYFLYLVLCRFPGKLQFDTIWIIKNIQEDVLSNHHPIYYTNIIKVFLAMGKWLNIDISYSIFAYSVFQIAIIAMIFGYVSQTIYCINRNRWGVFLFVLLFIIYPMNMDYIVYAVKDALFSFGGLLLVTGLYREVKGCRANLAIIFGALMVGLFRNNGKFIILVLTIMMIIWRKEIKSNCKRMVLLSLVIFLLQGPILNVIGVTKSEYAEGLSIPIQQVTRCVYDNCELLDTEKEQIDKLINVEKIPDYYIANWSDPMKGFMIFNPEKDKYLEEHKLEYLKLWFELGERYPKEYVKAYVDLTSGYWNAEYYPSNFNYNYEGEYYGIRQTMMNPSLNEIINIYMDVFSNNRWLNMTINIGLFFMFLCFLFMQYMWQERRDMALIILPAILLNGTLMIATPLNNERRYVYLLFLVSFFVIYILLKDTKTSNIRKQ